MGRVLCSTGAIITRKNQRNYHLLNTIVPQTHCDALEFMMYQSWHEESSALMNALSGYSVPVFHMTKQIGEWVSEGKLADALALFRADCALAAAMGAGMLVLHLWSGRASDQHFERNLAAYPVLREAAERHGLLLTVENVVCNCREPMSRLQQLADAYPDVSFTWDTKMAAFHSQQEALYLAENDWLLPRIRHFHVNDYAGGHMDWANLSARPLGTGRIDFDRFFAFVRQSGYPGDFTCEATAVNDDGSIRYDELNRSLDKIRKEAAP